jgi:hypothetical protein
MPEAALGWAGESILHGLVAAAVVLALLRLWNLGQPSARLRFVLLSLAFPVLVQPLLLVMAPQRHGEAFAEERALFALSRYRELVTLGSSADVLLVGGLSAIALALLLRDLMPFLAERFERQPPELAAGPLRHRLTDTVAELSQRLGLRNPQLRLVDAETPDISCSGLWRREIVVSSGVAHGLHPDELRAALAHELAHLRSHDPLLGWALLALRTVFFFNPAVQILARIAAREIENRADDVAVTLLGEPSVLAAALVKTFRGGLGRRRLRALLDPLRLGALERRCRRLLQAEPDRGLRAETTHLAATGLGLVVLLFFVV